MYNEHTNFLGEGRFFNISHGKVSSFLSANKENQQKNEDPLYRTDVNTNKSLSLPCKYVDAAEEGWGK